jgi:hypothetical protein
MKFTKSSLYSLGLLMISMVGCESAEKPPARYARETHKLEAYLQTMHLSIPEDSTSFLFISENGCGNCIAKSFDFFSGISSARIMLSKGAVSRYLTHYSFDTLKATVIIDSSEQVNRLAFHRGNVGVVSVSHGKIDTIVYIEYPTLREQLRSIRIAGR